MKISAQQAKWMMRTLSILGMILIHLHSQAQDKFSLSIKAGIGVPTHELGGTELKPGFGYEGTMGYQITNFVSAYAGWSQQFFAAKGSFQGLNLDFEETGYTVGIQFTYPAQPDEVHYSLAAGILYNHIEAENADGDVVADSGHELGAQFEGTIAIPISNTLYLIPFARYRTLDTDITIDDHTTATVLTYIGLGTGVKWTF
jgi:hypothetical protein